LITIVWELVFNRFPGFLNLIVHEWLFSEPFEDVRSFSKDIVARGTALSLNLSSASDKPAHHIEFGPINLGRLRRTMLLISFVRFDQVQHVNLQGRNARTLAVPKGHTVHRKRFGSLE